MNDADFLSKLNAMSQEANRPRDAAPDRPEELKLGAIMVSLWGNKGDGHLAKRLAACVTKLRNDGAGADIDSGGWHFGAKFWNSRRRETGSIVVAFSISATNPMIFVVRTFLEPRDLAQHAREASFPLDGYVPSEVEDFIDTSLLSAMETVMANAQA